MSGAAMRSSVAGSVRPTVVKRFSGGSPTRVMTGTPPSLAPYTVWMVQPNTRSTSMAACGASGAPALLNTRSDE